MSYIIDSRTWRAQQHSHESGCPHCGGPTTTQEKLYCRQSHQKQANRIRRGLRDGVLLDVAPGTCRLCGTEYERQTFRHLCSPKCRYFGRMTAYNYFRTKVKWPHDLPWLGGKLGLEADDPRLPDVALKLANAGKLYVYINRDGSIGDVGKPKPKPQKRPQRREKVVQHLDTESVLA